MPTAALEPTSRSTVPARLIRSPQRQPARLESPQATSLRPISSSPTWLGLDHASSVVSGVPRGKLSPFLPAPPTISRAQSPGYSKCPASELITFWAATRRQHLLRTPPGSPWQGHGIGHALEPSQRPPAQLTPRAADSRRSAPLAADATVRRLSDRAHTAVNPRARHNGVSAQRFQIRQHSESHRLHTA